MYEMFALNWLCWCPAPLAISGYTTMYEARHKSFPDRRISYPLAVLMHLFSCHRFFDSWNRYFDLHEFSVFFSLSTRCRGCRCVAHRNSAIKYIQSWVLILRQRERTTKKMIKMFCGFRPERRVRRNGTIQNKVEFALAATVAFFRLVSCCYRTEIASIGFTMNVTMSSLAYRIRSYIECAAHGLGTRASSFFSVSGIYFQST